MVALTAFLPHLLASVQPTLDFCRRLDSIVGPQLTVLASDICEQFNVNKRVSGLVLYFVFPPSMERGLGESGGFSLSKRTVSFAFPRSLRLQRAAECSVLSERLPGELLLSFLPTLKTALGWPALVVA